MTQWTLSDLDIANKDKVTRIVSTLAPEQAERKKIIVEGDSEDVVQKLLDQLRKEL